MRYLILLVFLITGSQSFVCAQNQLSGKITDTKNAALPGSHIHVGQVYAIADPSGNYSVSVPSGNNRITVSFIGFKTIDTVMVIDANTVLNLRLKQDVSQLGEVVVRENLLKPNATASKQELKTKTIEKYSNASLGDLLKEISGVSSLKTGNTIVKPVINGLHSSRVLIVNNNVRLEDQQWGLEHSPNLDVNTAGKVSVIKGASGLQYGGDAIGGVVIIEPQHVPLIDTLFGRTIINGSSNGRGGSITSSLFKGYATGWNWNLQGTFKYLGDVEAADYVLSNTGTREKNFSAGFGYKGKTSGFSAFYSYYNATIGILRASHTGNSADLANSINNGQPAVINDFTYDIDAPRQQVQHHLGKVNYYTDFEGLGKLTMQYAFQVNNRQEYDIRRGDDKNKPSLDLTLSTHSLNADFETQHTESPNYKFGVSGVYQNNYADTSTGVSPLIPDYDKYEFGVYSIGLFKLSEKLDLETGLRYDYSRIDATKFYLKSRWAQKGYDADFANLITGDYTTQWKTNPVFSYNNFSGSIGTKYHINNALKWFVNVGLATRSPNPSELFSDGLHHATGQIELGELRLDKEEAVKISTTLSYASKKLSFEVNPYVNLINNFTILLPTGMQQTIRGTFPVWEYSQVNARLMGVDITADYDFMENVNYHTTIAYVYGKDADNGKPLIDMPPLSFINAFTYVQPKWSNLVLGLKSETVFTQNRYPDNDFYTDVIVDGEPVSTLVKISKPPKGYNQFHFNSEVSFAVLEKSKMTIGFDIRNIMNTSYRDYLNRTRYYADDMGRNFTLQLKLNY